MVHQSDDDAVSRVVAAHLDAGARGIASSVRNRRVAVNLGMHRARNDVMLDTHDDRIVAASPVGMGWSHLSRHPAAIVTGCVIRLGEAASVTSTISDERRRDDTWRAPLRSALRRQHGVQPILVLEFGGFDERVTPRKATTFATAGRALVGVYATDRIYSFGTLRAKRLPRLTVSISPTGRTGVSGGPSPSVPSLIVRLPHAVRPVTPSGTGSKQRCVSGGRLLEIKHPMEAKTTSYREKRGIFTMSRNPVSDSAEVRMRQSPPQEFWSV